MKIAVLTALALSAFAANSLLCRQALGEQAIDAASFASLRMVSGTATLLLLAALSGSKARPSGSWAASAMLALYMVAFAFAYLRLDAGTGALILFATVQATMLAVALRQGERPAAQQWAGLALALGGLVYLLLPGFRAPSPGGAVLMAAAGMGWGFYSLAGRGSTQPLADTSRHFLRALPLVLAVQLFQLHSAHASWRGVSLAILSGALASGVGYAVWYAALRGLTATRAALVQLAVPALAAVGGMLFLGESFSQRLALAMVLILGGVALAVSGRPGTGTATPPAR